MLFRSIRNIHKEPKYARTFGGDYRTTILSHFDKLPEGHHVQIDTPGDPNHQTVSIVHTDTDKVVRDGINPLNFSEHLKNLQDDLKDSKKPKKLDEQVLSKIVNRIFNRRY